MTPLIGFFPPTTAYVPAINEAWLEVDSSRNTISLHVGSEVVEHTIAEGISDYPTGNYYVTNKIENPVWIANDEYFSSRGLSIPVADNDFLRMRKGALGKMLIESSDNLSIHSAPLWTSEVGGIRAKHSDLSPIFESLPIGAPIVVK